MKPKGIGEINRQQGMGKMVLGIKSAPQLPSKDRGERPG